MLRNPENSPTSCAAPASLHRCCKQALRPFWSAVETGHLECGSLGGFLSGGDDYQIHRFTLRGESDGNTMMRLGISATIHGDEPQGTQALLELALPARLDPGLFRGYELQTAASVAALSAILRRYRSMLAVADGI